VRKEAVDEAVSAIEATYKVKVVVLPTKPLPDAAYYKPRRRYRAEKLLSALEGMMPSGEDKIVGLTEVDISTTKGEYPDWGIFGLGNMPGQACVVSTWRLSSRKSQQTFRKRLGKVVVHELGHTFGLDHCPVRGCLMEDARGRVSTVDRETGFCESCRAKLRGFLLR
jgi:archaemetzincin